MLKLAVMSRSLEIIRPALLKAPHFRQDSKDERRESFRPRTKVAAACLQCRLKKSKVDNTHCLLLVFLLIRPLWLMFSHSATDLGLVASLVRDVGWNASWTF
jgi:hypothetical protein